MQSIKNPKNIKEALDWGTNELGSANVSDAKFNAEILLGEAFGLERHEIYTSLDKKPSVKEWGKFFDFVESRKQGSPLQYIIGHTYFRDLKISVGPQVLIPRPETEMLVDLALKELKAEKPKVLDLCCGSGCIACAVASELKDASVVAVDVSNLALNYAYKNCEDLGLAEKIMIINADIKESLPLGNDFDMLISNPPYVPNDIYEKMPKEVVNFEPSLALRAGKDGLDFLPDIIRISKSHLKKGGTLALELFEDSISMAAKSLKKEGLENIKTFCDLANKERYIIASI